MKSVAQSFAVGSGGPNLNVGQFSSRAFLFPSVCPASAPSPEDTVKGSATKCHGAPAARAVRWLVGIAPPMRKVKPAPGVRPAPRGLAPLCSCRLPSVTVPALTLFPARVCQLLDHVDATDFFCPHLGSVNLSVPRLSVCLPVDGFFIQSFTNMWPHTPDTGCWGYSG